MKSNRRLQARLFGAALAAAALFGAPSWLYAQAGGTAGTTTGTTSGPTAGTTTTTSAGFTGGSGSGSTSTATSTSFAGSTATQFSGGQGLSFSGGSGGTTSTGILGGAARGGTSYTAPSPTSYNPFTATYISPLAAGATALSSTTSMGSATTTASGARTGTGAATSTAAIARALYPPSSTTTTGRTGSGGFGSAGFGSVAGAGGTTYRGPSSSFTTYGTYRNPSYITTLDESIPIVAHAAPELQRNLQTMLDNSAALRKLRGLDVAVDSGTVVLRGAVTSERERKLVEGMVRLTPGVRDVRNELSVVK